MIYCTKCGTYNTKWEVQMTHRCIGCGGPLC